MKVWGVVLTICGVLFAIGALLMGSTVPQEVPYSIDLPSLTRTQEMHNLPRAQLQMLMYIGGCTLFVGGLLLIAAAQIEQAVSGRWGSPTPVDTVVADAPAVVTPAPLVPALSPEEQAASDKAGLQFAIGGGVLLVAFVAFLLYLGNTAEPKKLVDTTAAASENLEQIADNLEAQAESISAEANAADLQ